MHELTDAGVQDACCVCLEKLGMMHAFKQTRVPTVKRMLVQPCIVGSLVGTR